MKVLVQQLVTTEISLHEFVENYEKYLCPSDVGGTSPYAKMLSRPKEGDKRDGRGEVRRRSKYVPLTGFSVQSTTSSGGWVVAGRLQVNDARRVAGHSFPPTYKLRIVHAFPTLHTNLKLQEGHDPICHCS